MLFGAKKYTIVDIGSHSIKAVRMKNNKGETEIIDTGIIKLPPDTIEEGKITDISIIANELKQIFSDMNYTPNHVITTVSNNHVIIRNLEVPPMEEDELEETIKWEADDQIPFPVEHARFKYIIVERDEEKVKVLLVAVKNEIVDNYMKPFEKIGINTRVINVQPMALLSLLEFNEELTEPVAIIDIGASGTQVTIGTDENINLSRTISTGGKEFTDTLVEGMGYSVREAEEFKIENGIQKMEEIDGEDFDLDSLQIATSGMGGGALNSLAVSLAEEISRSLDFYSMKHRGRKVNKIYITGGGSRLKGLKELISQEIEQKLLPLETFKKFPSFQVKENKSREELAVAIGLGVSEVLNDES